MQTLQRENEAIKKMFGIPAVKKRFMGKMLWRKIIVWENNLQGKMLLEMGDRKVKGE